MKTDAHKGAIGLHQGSQHLRLPRLRDFATQPEIGNRNRVTRPYELVNARLTTFGTIKKPIVSHVELVERILRNCVTAGSIRPIKEDRIDTRAKR